MPNICGTRPLRFVSTRHSRDNCRGNLSRSQYRLCRAPENRTTNATRAMMAHDDVIEVLFLDQLQDILPYPVRVFRFRHPDLGHHLRIRLESRFIQVGSGSRDQLLCPLPRHVCEVHDVDRSIIAFHELGSEAQGSETALRAIDWREYLHEEASGKRPLQTTVYSSLLRGAMHAFLPAWATVTGLPFRLGGWVSDKDSLCRGGREAELSSVAAVCEHGRKSQHQRNPNADSHCVIERERDQIHAYHPECEYETVAEPS
jgi:hypothetical protein